MNDTHSAVCSRWFDAFNAHDIDGLCRVAHEEIELIPISESITVPAGTTYHGLDGLRSMVLPMWDEYPTLQSDPHDGTSHGEWMVVPVAVTFDETTTPVLKRSVVSVFMVKQDSVVKLLGFETESEAMAALSAFGRGPLTPREREILTLLAAGLTAEQAAEKLVLSPYTVRTHVRNAKERLGARTSGHAIAIALRDHALDD